MIRRLIANLFCLCGLSAAIYGVWQYSEPAAWLCGGVVAFVVGVLVLRVKGSDVPNR